MNNWRLLLLALVAIFQPITSFTERHLVDGRQQCCDRQTDTLLRNSRPSLYGTDRIAEASSSLRRLHETREDRQLRQRVSGFTRRSTERLLLNIRERDIEQSPSIEFRSNRIVHRTERGVLNYNDKRQIGGQQRERNILTRVSMMQRNGGNELISRYAVSRNEPELLERQNNQQARMQMRSSNNLRQTTSATNTQLRMLREDVERILVAHDNRRLLVEERVNELTRERLFPDYVRHNNERHDPERYNELPKSLSDNSRIVERVRDMPIRINSRDERQENIHTNRRLVVRERVSVLQHEPMSRDDLRNNNERREVERNTEQRRSFSENSRIAERVRDMQIRVNSRNERQENTDHSRRLVAKERVNILLYKSMSRDDVRHNNKRRELERHSEQRRSFSENSRNERQENADDSRRLVARERVNKLLHKSMSRDDVRHNNKRRELERHTEQRRSLSENSRVVERVRDMQIRINSRNERQENEDHSRRFAARERVSVSLHEPMSRDDVRHSNERSKLASYTEERQSFSENSRIVEQVRDIQTRVNSRDTRQETADHSRRLVARERVSVLLHKPTTRDNLRHNNERRELERYTEEQRSFSKSSKIVNRVRDMQIRVNSRDERHKNARDIRPLVVRERVIVLLRESLSSKDVRHNNRRREPERYAEQRQSSSDNSKVVDRVRDIPIRLNNRDERLENQDRLMAGNRRLNSDYRESGKQIREITIRRQSRDVMNMDRRDGRDARLTIDRNIRDRDMERQSGRQSRQIRDGHFIQESRESRRIIDKKHGETHQWTRSGDVQSFSDTRAVSKLGQSADWLILETDVTRREITYRDRITNQDRDIVDRRFRTVEARENGIMINKIETESETVRNWQYVFYTVQAAYLCGLIIQTLMANGSEKSKMMNLQWWSLSSRRAIKVD